MRANAYTVTRTVVETVTILTRSLDDAEAEIDEADRAASETPIQYWVRDIKETETIRDPSKDYEV